MSDWLVGARYACPKCLLRGCSIVCARCRGRSLDLASEADRAALVSAWPLARAWGAGRSIFSPLAIPHARGVLRFAGVLSVIGWVGAPLMALSEGRAALDAAGIFVAGTCFLPFTIVIYAFVGFYLAHALTFLAFLYALVGAAIAPARIVSTLLEAASRLLLPRLTRDERRPVQQTSRTGVLMSELIVETLVDETGWVAFRDADMPPLRVRVGEQPLDVELQAGVLSLPLWNGPRPELSSGEKPASYRDAASRAEPAHWQAYGRGRRSRRSIAAGTTVILRDGQLEGGTLRGTAEAPLWLEIM